MVLLAGLANMRGEGLPLSYLFVVTDVGAPAHTKEEGLVNWMGAPKSGELPDKDQTEINALASALLAYCHTYSSVKNEGEFSSNDWIIEHLFAFWLL